MFILVAWSACIPCVAVLQAGKLSRHTLEIWLALLLARKFFGLYMEQVLVPGPSSYRLDNPASSNLQVTEQFSVTHCDINGYNCVRPTL